MKKKEGFNINVNFSNRWLYTLITIGILMIISVGVYAWANPTTGVGHTHDEIEPCSEGQILQMSEGAWSCVDISVEQEVSCSVSYTNCNLYLGYDVSSWAEKCIHRVITGYIPIGPGGYYLKCCTISINCN